MPDKDRAGRVVFVGNIPYGLSEEQVVHLFSQCGTVVSFRLVYDKDTGKPKGYGFAEFTDADSAATAVRNLNGYETMGRTLRVDYSSEAGSGDAGANVAAPSGGMQHQQQQNLTQQQHYQQFQLQHQQQQQATSGPTGVALPDNVSAPDAISRTLAAMDPKQLLDIIAQMKELISNDTTRVHGLLTSNPQLSYALFQALLLMGLVDTSVLGQVVEANAQAKLQSYQPQPTPTPYQPPQPPPQYAPPPTYPQPTPQPMQPHFAQAPQFMGAAPTPPIPTQAYAPPAPPAAAPKPPHLTDSQWESIRQLCSIPQQQIDAMINPTEKQSIMTIRQQYMPYFARQYGIPGY